MAPPNDTVATAELITIPSTVNGTTVGATVETSAAYPSGYFGEPDVFYKFVTTEPTYVRVKAYSATGFQIYAEIYAPLDGVFASNLDELDLDNFPGNAWFQNWDDGSAHTQRFVLPAGTWYVMLSDYAFDGSTGDFTLEWSLVPIVASDLDYTGDQDTANDPSSVESTFVTDPYDVLYLQIARGFPHSGRADFEIRKTGQKPPGDEFDDRYIFTGNPAAICTPTNAQVLPFDQNYWNNSRATASDGEPAHAGFGPNKSVWFQWDNPTPGAPYDIWVESTADDFVLSVYDMAPTLAELGPAIAEDDDSGDGNQPLVTVVPTGNLIIAVDSKGGGGAFVLKAKLSSATRPVNDDWADAEVLPGTSGTVSGDLVGASYECGTPQSTATAFPGGFDYYKAIGGDVWYKFTPTGNDYTLTWTSPTGVRISIYTAFNPLAPQLDQLILYPGFNGNGAVYDDAGSITFGVTPSATYYVRVEQVDTAQDTIDFTWVTPTPEAGDQFESAPDLTPSAPPDGGSFDWVWDLTGAGQQSGEPKDKPTDTVRSVWRTFTPAHDCTVFMRSSTQFQVLPSGATIDTWRGNSIGALDMVAGQMTTMNRGEGFRTYYAVRLRKGEQYRFRISNPNTSPPISGTLTTVVQYEMDTPWTDGDGWDSETGTPADWTDGVLTFSEAGYRTIKPWVGDLSSRYVYISFDVRLESEWSPTAADGPVLGRQPGPTTHYPYAGNRITVMRMHYGGGGVFGGFVMAMDIVGDRDGNSYLELWNEVGGGGAVNRTIWNDFALPNAQTEGGEWIHIDVTPNGVYVNGRLGLTDSSLVVGMLTTIDWGPVRFPTRQGWNPGDDPPETWTLQLQDMRITDRVVDGPSKLAGPMIAEFDTRLMHRPNPGTSGAPSGLYPLEPYFVTGGGSALDPVARELENPSANPNHQWDAVRIHDESASWQIWQRDTAFRHNGFWVTFDAFPNPGESVVVGVLRAWSGAGNWGYYNDLCRLEVNNLGELWIDPFRWFQRPGNPGYSNFSGDPNASLPKIPEPRRQKIGQMVLNEAYWIETWIDFSFPWDARMRVAVNEVECFPEYRALINQTDDSRVSLARYTAGDPVYGYNELAVGAPSGTPFQVSGGGSNIGAYTGHVDVYVGPWFVGRGGTPTTSPAKPTGAFPIGAHAGAVFPAATRSGTHRIPDASTLDKFETTPAAMASACDGFFEYQGVRFYKGSKSLDVSINWDMSAGITGYSPSNIGAAPSLTPVNVSDGSGPVGPFGDDYSGENALEVAKDPSAFGGPESHTRYGANWQYIYVGNAPPGGVREGGDPNDDGGNHFLMFAWMRRVGGTNLYVDMCYDVRGDLGAGPVYYPWPDTLWHQLWGTSYPNYDLSGGTDAYGVWRFIFYDGAVVHIKQMHQFMNAHTYPRFKVTTDNGASSFWIITPTEPVHTYLADDPNDATWQAGIFMDNVCPFDRFDRTGPNVPGLLGEPPTGISMGDYRPRRFVEVKPPVEADLEDMNVRPSALKVVVRGAGFGGDRVEFGDVSTARTNGTLKVRMTHGNVRHVVHDFPMSNVDRVIRSQTIPMTPSGFSWQADRVSELTTRMGFHFNYHDKSLDDSYGYRILQHGSAICKALAYEVFAESVPGPPICTVGAKWKSRLTRRI